MNHSGGNFIIAGSAVNLKLLKRLQARPEPFTPGEPLFWDDPHISKQMLAAHLDPTNDLASRRPETIDRSVAWLVETLGLRVGTALLDLGCGPGLYAARFAERGLSVTGIDTSRRSIDYAQEHARRHGLQVRYRHQDYLTLDDREQYQVALLIYGDFCPLSPGQRSCLLRNVLQALKPGGYFVLDVTTRAHRKRHGMSNSWYVAESGFWKPGWHLVLEQGFDYPERSIYLDQVLVIEPHGKVSIYRMWFQDYTQERIRGELEGGGFTIQSVWNDLAGTPYTEDGEWIGIIARKSL
jgi:SAM-dependent methyltransferase